MKGFKLTVLIVNSPSLQPLKSREAEQLLGAQLRVLEALLDLDALKRPDTLAENSHVADGEDECLVTATLVAVVDKLAMDSPVWQVEDLVVENSVGVDEAVQNESKTQGKRLLKK